MENNISKKQTILTGVKPTGIPHIGNYFGAIKPAIDASKTNSPLRQEGCPAGVGCVTNNNAAVESYLFIADYHALTTVKNVDEMRLMTRQLACTWLACGLDINNTVFYRQSDVPEIFEIATILSNTTAKGLLNRAHAYKAITQASVDTAINGTANPDENVNVGLYIYPILMAADILAFDTTLVPVGKDQKQHIEIAGDIARAFNAFFKTKGRDGTLTIPTALIKEDVMTIPGLDGRKMSKSYGNQIPLFGTAKELEKKLKQIVTDSSLPHEPKSTDMTIFEIYKLFATTEELEVMRKKFATGIGWGDVKGELVRVAEREIAPMRERYNYYMENFHEVEAILARGATNARLKAQEVLKRIRTAIGVG